jgi:hypothetical protein
MTDYLTFDIETDPDTLAQDAFDYLADRVPGWQPSDGNLDTWIIEATARMAAEVADVAAVVPASIFRAFGASIVGLPAQEATNASAASTWTVRDASGYTIPAGTPVGITGPDGTVVAFETVADALVAPGQTTKSVPLVATDAGAAGSGLNGAISRLDSLDFVTLVTLDGVTSGGVDAEADVDYLARLSSTLRLLAPRPILPNDFAVMARSVAGVGRTLAIDGYNPDSGTFNNERTIAVAVADSTGEAVSSGVRDAVDALLQAQREVNFVVRVISPTYTAIAVTFTAVRYPGFDTVDVHDRAIAALTEYLSPANWGTPDSGDAADAWLLTPVVRYLEVASRLNQVEGLNYLTALTVNGGTVDVALAGAAPLPRPGVLTGTVNAP